ncbi:hypothetical protein DCO47_09190 [Pseudomonas sp. NDM]|nr:hypothetical protein DCO47_09190 [Pseudomonas sp. NDM]
MARLFYSLRHKLLVGASLLAKAVDRTKHPNRPEAFASRLAPTNGQRKLDRLCWFSLSSNNESHLRTSPGS